MAAKLGSVVVIIGGAGLFCIRPDLCLPTVASVTLGRGTGNGGGTHTESLTKLKLAPPRVRNGFRYCTIQKSEPG
jgi:hypothetical protein